MQDLAKDAYEQAKKMNKIQPLLKNIYAIEDVDMGFVYIFENTNHMIALRTFANMTSDKNSPVGQQPDKHNLYFITSIDGTTGEIKCNDKPIKLGNGAMFIKNNG